MEKSWLKQYPAGVPAEIKTDLYPSLVALLEESFRKFRDQKAYLFMGKAFSFGQIDDLSRAFAAYLQSSGLAPGDRVITRSGAKVLKAIEVVVVRDAAMVRISVSALGHDRPEGDLYVAPSQPILVRDWRAKALYGRAVTMIEAQRLADGDYIRREMVAEVRLFTLRFEREEVVYASGLELACAPVSIPA